MINFILNVEISAISTKKGYFPLARALYIRKGTQRRRLRRFMNLERKTVYTEGTRGSSVNPQDLPSGGPIGAVSHKLQSLLSSQSSRKTISSSSTLSGSQFSWNFYNQFLRFFSSTKYCASSTFVTEFYDSIRIWSILVRSEVGSRKMKDIYFRVEREIV